MAVFPFSAIVAQDELKLSLLMVAVDPTIGGVLVFGDGEQVLVDLVLQRRAQVMRDAPEYLQGESVILAWRVVRSRLLVMTPKHQIPTGADMPKPLGPYS